MRQLIKRILKEEREKDSSDLIKKLLNNSVVNDYKGMICSIDVVAPWKRGPIGSHSDFKDYQIRVNVIGGIGTKRWPQTQFVYKERDKIVNDVWHTVYNFMGLSTDVFLRNVMSCDEVLTESSNERLEKLIDNYISMSYPTAKKIKLAPPGVNGSITTPTGGVTSGVGGAVNFGFAFTPYNAFSLQANIAGLGVNSSRNDPDGVAPLNPTVNTTEFGFNVHRQTSNLSLVWFFGRGLWKKN